MPMSPLPWKGYLIPWGLRSRRQRLPERPRRPPRRVAASSPPRHRARPRVVVPGDDVVDPFRIAVRVDEPHDGDPETGGLVDGDVLLLRINHEEAARKPRHLLDAAQVLLQLVHLVL